MGSSRPGGTRLKMPAHERQQYYVTGQSTYTMQEQGARTSWLKGKTESQEVSEGKSDTLKVA